jgi:hypothetical protein
MYRIFCQNCERVNEFTAKTSMPSDCQYCFEEFPANSEIDTVEVSPKKPLGLTLVCQQTQERIDIPASQKTIMGREYTGREIFTKLLHEGSPIVSRKHCSVEFKEGFFHLIDEGSLNGTFYGVNKLSCKECARIIEDRAIIFIGKEIFIAEIQYADNLNETSIEKGDTEDSHTAASYRCNNPNCHGYESSHPFDICPKCDSFRSYVPS